MYPVPKGLTGFEGKLQYVDTCPNSPQVGMAFCQNHCVVAAEQGIPTQLREYRSYLAARKSSCTTAPVSDSTTNAADCQGMPLTENQSSSSSEKQTQCMCNYITYLHVGTTATLTHNRRLAVAINGGEEVEETATACNKDTGEQKKMQKWTRGIWCCVSGGGHIHMWQPLYK